MTNKTGIPKEKYLWSRTWELFEEFLIRERDGKKLDFRSPEELLKSLSLDPHKAGMTEKEVLDRIEAVMAATPSSSHWRFLNQLFGGREPVALSAEILGLLANSSLYTFKAAGAQVLVEKIVLEKMLEAAGFSLGEGAFVPGGSAANLTAMLLARNTRYPFARDQGLGTALPVVYTSEEGHYSIKKNAGILGLGRSRVRKVRVTPEGTMDPEDLKRLICADLNAGLEPLLVVGTAGTTVRGAVDPFNELAEISQKYKLWFHVDGALGGSLLLSKKHRHLLEGVEKADSLAWNPHKMMGVPLQTSVVLVSKKGLLASSLDETADYLYQSEQEEYNPGHRSLQCGRRNDAFRLWAAWCRLGDDGWDDRLNRQMALARKAALLISQDPDLKLAQEPFTINVLFSVKGRSSKEVCDTLNREGRLKIGYGEAGGQQLIRLVCVNPNLSEENLIDILKEIKKT